MLDALVCRALASFPETVWDAVVALAIMKWKDVRFKI